MLNVNILLIILPVIRNSFSLYAELRSLTCQNIMLYLFYANGIKLHNWIASRDKSSAGKFNAVMFSIIIITLIVNKYSDIFLQAGVLSSQWFTQFRICSFTNW